jgi:N-acetylglucosaminyl-diphospho-decaprenol L-rhamnosyltransferase
VTFESAAWIAACLESVLAQRGVGRVVVADSGSTDVTGDVVAGFVGRGVVWLPLRVNRGFGAAANRGVAETNSSAVAIVNADLVMEADALTALEAALSATERCAVVGPLVTDFAGRPYPSARSFPRLVDAIGHGFVGLVWKTNPWSHRYLDPDRVDWISGTAMVVRRSAFESVGGFDEAYFMYVEDVDLCWRLARAGWSVAVAADATVRHAVGGSSETAPFAMIVAHHRSLWRFACRSTTGWSRAALPVVAAGLVARAAAVSLRRVFVAQAPAAR